ncbi:hypothetical protein ARMGADRAFT_1134807 [Armillaria gallica]|uniref:Uncharacterized protein n=1 Tax=Armillaria gallica TaxID=47427 RepID=A0A2H3E1A0_ARMGA|nr:hypothetical protein ARMGADRAFT_1134807 [Armillaria gallica]
MMYTLHMRRINQRQDHDFGQTHALEVPTSVNDNRSTSIHLRIDRLSSTGGETDSGLSKLESGLAYNSKFGPSLETDKSASTEHRKSSPDGVIIRGQERAEICKNTGANPSSREKDTVTSVDGSERIALLASCRVKFSKEYREAQGQPEVVTTRAATGNLENLKKITRYAGNQGAVVIMKRVNNYIYELLGKGLRSAVT